MNMKFFIFYLFLFFHTNVLLANEGDDKVILHATLKHDRGDSSDRSDEEAEAKRRKQAEPIFSTFPSSFPLEFTLGIPREDMPPIFNRTFSRPQAHHRMFPLDLETAHRNNVAYLLQQISETEENSTLISLYESLFHVLTNRNGAVVDYDLITYLERRTKLHHDQDDNEVALYLVKKLYPLRDEHGLFLYELEAQLYFLNFINEREQAMNPLPFPLPDHMSFF